MVLARVIIFQLFPTWSGKGLSLGPFRKKWSQEKNLIRNMWICDGPGKARHSSNFSQHGLARGCLGDHFGKSEPTTKAYQESLWNWRPWQRASFSQLFPTWFGKGLSPGAFWKKRTHGKSLSGIFVKLMALTRGIIFPTFPNMVWQGVVLGSILEKVKPRQPTAKAYQESL